MSPVYANGNYDDQEEEEVLVGVERRGWEIHRREKCLFHRGRAEKDLA